MKRRHIAITLGALVAIADLAVYRGQAAVDRARLRTSDPGRAIVLLEKHRKLAPWDDRLFLELGRAYFESGVGRLTDASRRDLDLRKSLRCYLRALTLNPLSAASHFYFAQALQYANVLELSDGGDSLHEYMNAARLSGQDPQIYEESGRVMFARWAALAPADRDFARSVARSVLARPSPDLVERFLAAWEMSVKDPSVLAMILPDDAAAFRQVARFFGDRSLPHAARLDYLVRADTLDFGTARDETAAGWASLAALKPRAARVRFQNARTALDRIVFAQNLSGKSAIDRLEFQNLRKSVLLGLAKCALEETRRLDGALEDIDAYLELEDKSSAVADLESLLKGLNLVGDASGAGARDFDRLLLQLRLDFKQSRFREIIQAGQSLDRSLLVIPEAMKSDYVRILELVGDAYRKLDYIYESNALYARALETGGQDVGLLLKTRKNFERLNDAERLAAVDRDIRALTARDEAAQPAVVLARNAPLVRELILDGGNIRLTAAFEALGPEPFPLVSVVFNGQLVWDRVPDATGLSLTLPSDIGRNSLAISVLGGTVRLSRLGFAPAVGPVTHLP